MKKQILILLLTLAVLPLRAQLITTMNIHRTDGTILYLPLNTIDSITYTVDKDVNCPRITNVQVSQQEVEGGTNFTFRITVESKYQVNWLDLCLEGPNGNIYGGGSGANFTQIGSNVWEHVHTDFISEYMPNGEYRYYCIRVENSGSYRSETWPSEPTLTITTHTHAATKPTIADVTLTQQSVSGGTNLNLSVVATSNAPLDFFSSSLDGPNGSIYGGGSGVRFTEISEGVYRYDHTDFISEWMPNGEYYYSHISVESVAGLESDAWAGEVKTTITGHKTGITAPVINSVTLTKQAVSGGTNLSVKIVATSNAPVEWLTICLESPNGSIYGGGNGRNFTEIAAGVYEYTQVDFISSDYPSGKYTYSCIQVENAAGLESEVWSQPVETTIINQ